MPVPNGETLRTVFASPRLASATALAAIGVGVFAELLQRVIGWAGLVGMLSTVVVVALGIVVARLDELEWQGLLPLSLLIFVGLATISIAWSQYQWSSLGGIAYLVAFTALGIAIALTRDTIQIVRAFGDVFRVALAASIALEFFAGVLIDTPLPFLGIEGNLAELGPIQGVMAGRNQLGVLALLALVTFTLEFLTRSIERKLVVGSMIAAALVIALTRSPVVLAVSLVVALAAAVLYGIRQAKPERRVFWQVVALVAALVLAIVAWVLRSPIIAAFSANQELGYRLGVWGRAWDLIAVRPSEGWGWIGYWRPEVYPFTAFAIADEREPTSALNAYLDVWFQLGLIGIFTFVVLLALTFTRSWLLAGQRTSIVFAWPALVLVVLIITALAESSLLVEYGWLTFVVCCVKAARELRWRRAFVSSTA